MQSTTENKRYITDVLLTGHIHFRFLRPCSLRFWLPHQRVYSIGTYPQFDIISGSNKSTRLVIVNVTMAITDADHIIRYIGKKLYELLNT